MNAPIDQSEGELRGPAVEVVTEVFITKAGAHQLRPSLMPLFTQVPRRGVLGSSPRIFFLVTFESRLSGRLVT